MTHGRDIIESFDLLIGKGLQERMYDFRDSNEEIELKPILEHIAAQPQLDLTCSAETEAELPSIVGGLSVALARTFRIIDPDLKNPDYGVGARLRHLQSAAVDSRHGSAGIEKGERSVDHE